MKFIDWKTYQLGFQSELRKEYKKSAFECEAITPLTPTEAAKIFLDMGEKRANGI